MLLTTWRICKGVQHHINSLAINSYAQKWWGARNNFATCLCIYDMKYSNTSRTRSYAGIQYAFKCQDSCCTDTSNLSSFSSIIKKKTLISLLLALNVWVRSHMWVLSWLTILCFLIHSSKRWSNIDKKGGMYLCKLTCTKQRVFSVNDHLFCKKLMMFFKSEFLFTSNIKWSFVILCFDQIFNWCHFQRF